MAAFRFGALFLGVWGLDLLFSSIFPSFRLWADPFLLLLIFQGFRPVPSRFLWLWGVGLGLAKELTSSGLFGAWACTFAGVGWGMAVVRIWMDLEDPVVAAVFVGLFTLLGWVLHGLLITAADPLLRWSHLPWAFLLAQVLLHGIASLWLFSWCDRFLKRRPLRLGL